MSMPIPNLSFNTSSSATSSGSAAGASFGDFGFNLTPKQAPSWRDYLPIIAVAGVAFLIWRGR